LGVTGIVGKRSRPTGSTNVNADKLSAFREIEVYLLRWHLSPRRRSISALSEAGLDRQHSWLTAVALSPVNQCDCVRRVRGSNLSRPPTRRNEPEPVENQPARGLGGWRELVPGLASTPSKGQNVPKPDSCTATKESWKPSR
jgi:hypothetical protein